MRVPVVIFHDHIAAYGVIRALGPQGIPIYIVSERGTGIALRSRYIRKTLVLPSAHASFSEDLNLWVTRHVGEEAVLIPAGSDDYLDVLSQNIGELAPGIRPTFPNWERTRLLREKNQTFELAKAAGISIPETRHIRSRQELQQTLRYHWDAGFPVVMKPGSSKAFVHKFGSQAMICHTAEEVQRRYDECDEFWHDLILQEFIPGNENCLLNILAVLNHAGDPLGLFVNRKRRSVRRFSTCTLMETAWSDDALTQSVRFLKSIGYYGYANPEYKIDPRDGRPKLMEINGRVTMSNSHALRCGINLPLLMYREAMGESVPCLNEIRKTYPEDILWWDIRGDVSSIIMAIRNGDASTREVLHTFKMRGCIIEPLSIRDPWPGLIVLKFIAAMAARAVWKWLRRGCRGRESSPERRQKETRT